MKYCVNCKKKFDDDLELCPDCGRKTEEFSGERLRITSEKIYRFLKDFDIYHSRTFKSVTAKKMFITPSTLLDIFYWCCALDGELSSEEQKEIIKAFNLIEKNKNSKVDTTTSFQGFFYNFINESFPNDYFSKFQSRLVNRNTKQELWENVWNSDLTEEDYISVIFYICLIYALNGITSKNEKEYFDYVFSIMQTRFISGATVFGFAPEVMFENDKIKLFKMLYEPFSNYVHYSFDKTATKKDKEIKNHLDEFFSEQKFDKLNTFITIDDGKGGKLVSTKIPFEISLKKVESFMNSTKNVISFKEYLENLMSVLASKEQQIQKLIDENGPYIETVEKINKLITEEQEFIKDNIMYYCIKTDTPQF